GPFTRDAQESRKTARLCAGKRWPVSWRRNGRPRNGAYGTLAGLGCAKRAVHRRDVEDAVLSPRGGRGLAHGIKGCRQEAGGRRAGACVRRRSGGQQRLMRIRQPWSSKVLTPAVNTSTDSVSAAR